MERQSSGWIVGAWKLRAEDLWPMQITPNAGAA
jgi:hypothetical protein